MKIERLLNSSKVSSWINGSLYRPWNSSPPSWISEAGAISSARNGSSYSYQLQSSESTTSYSISSGSLPTGLSLNQSTGLISGTPNHSVSDYSSTNVTFSIIASNATGEMVSRQFTIPTFSKYIGFSCATASEGGTAAATMPSGYIINRVDFISYGTPNGSCGAFTLGGCHAGYNTSSWIGQTSFSISASNGVFGDPCDGTAKRLYIQVSYGLTT